MPAVSPFVQKQNSAWSSQGAVKRQVSGLVVRAVPWRPSGGVKREGAAECLGSLG